MEWLILALAGAGGATYAGRRLRVARDDRRRERAELEAVHRAAEEDVTVFGEQLQTLGEEVEDHELDEATRRDYQVALDAYETAKWDAPRLREADQISSLLDTLASGRYAMACVRAGVAGHARPELRVPCFFNPQHGPSATDVMYTMPRQGTRRLPVCRWCDARVKAREKPELRTVEIGARRVPYWEAGAAYLPYTQGYFATGLLATGPSVSWVWDTAIAGDGGFGHHDSGHGGGFEGGAGGYDGGGGDT